MSKDLQSHPWIQSSSMALGLLGLAASGVVAQVPPDIVVDTDPNASGTSGTVVNNPGDRRFVCQYNQGQYTVMYQPESRQGEMYSWAVPRAMGGGWSADRRCEEIARRLEMYRDDGLVELTTSRENGYDIVCVNTERNPTCQIVFTVPQGQNAIATRNQVFENLLNADSGLQTQGVNTFLGTGSSLNSLLGQLQGLLGGDSPRPVAQSNLSDGISLKPFLDPSDGGTGEYLTQNRGTTTSPNSTNNGLRLNTDALR
ncbi:COP23 domain-containing protein [Picosynechococcus sp. NKBG15041c]|uniref:COP23 domain-containing protein n=1 Tax=Picosynechococcus sp. NKBG15041c TaxID=1407650 RepID=UPI000464D6CA|nr:COP23 domain-containing protein [Picosynechococcus sp. NKBG15041c]